MRIISGKYKGKNLKGYDMNGTRPTMDRVKESIFNIIQNNIQDSVCLDLFAGSGSLGLEAISRGAKYVYFNDINRDAVKVINYNIQAIDAKGSAFVLCKDYIEVLKLMYREGISLDLIFLDPPYNMLVINDILLFIDNNNILSDKGLIICEYNEMNLDKEYLNFEKFTTKKYGNKYVTIYKNKKM